ncbi:hypothetical protein YC2023_080099 [Brassica napus]
MKNTSVFEIVCFVELDLGESYGRSSCMIEMRGCQDLEGFDLTAYYWRGPMSRDLSDLPGLAGYHL